MTFVIWMNDFIHFSSEGKKAIVGVDKDAAFYNKMMEGETKWKRNQFVK